MRVERFYSDEITAEKILKELINLQIEILIDCNFRDKDAPNHSNEGSEQS